MIWAVIDCPYISYIKRIPTPAPTPTVGAVYDCTIQRFLIRAVVDRSYTFVMRTDAHSGSDSESDSHCRCGLRPHDLDLGSHIGT